MFGFDPYAIKMPGHMEFFSPTILSDGWEWLWEISFAMSISRVQPHILVPGRARPPSSVAACQPAKAPKKMLPRTAEIGLYIRAIDGYR